jgi:hypothetical protein
MNDYEVNFIIQTDEDIEEKEAIQEVIDNEPLLEAEGMVN